MLEARSLTKYYNHTAAVRDVSFAIKPGEILGYLGSNGAGKSTTVKMLTGMVDPSAGQIFYQGRSVHDDLTAFQRRIGYVPEEAHLYPHLTGSEYLQLVGRLRGMPRRILEPKMDQFLRLFSLWDDRHAALSSYSKGMGGSAIALGHKLQCRHGNQHQHFKSHRADRRAPVVGGACRDRVLSSGAKIDVLRSSRGVAAGLGPVCELGCKKLTRPPSNCCAIFCGVSSIATSSPVPVR